LNGQFVDNSQNVEIPFTITYYTTRHGLPQNQIEHIVAKKNGELLLATANGIVSYDGNSFSNFIKNEEYKKTIHIKLICSERYKKLYGLELGGKFSQIDPVSRHINNFTSVCAYNDKIYGILPNGAIAIFNPKDNTTKKLFNTGIKQPGAIHFDGKRFVILSSSGAYTVGYKTGKTTRISGLSGEKIKENPFTHEIYIMGKTRVFKLQENNRIQRLFPNQHFSDFDFHDITFTADDELYIASSRGLIHYRYGYCELYDRTKFLPSENLRSIYYDKNENCLFAGTGNKGLLKLQLKNCASLMQFPEISNSSISSTLLTRSGKLLACSSNGTIYSVGTKVSPYINLLSQAASLSEIGDEIWAGSWGQGVYRIKDGKIIGKIGIPQLRSGVVHGAFKDSHGTIWISTNEGISAGKSLQTIKPILEKQVLGQIITICEKKNGNLLFGGNFGIDEVDRNGRHLHHWGQKEGLKCKEVRSFYEDASHKIWVGTYDGGLYCLDKGKITSINGMQNCLLNEDVFTLGKDLAGNIYMTSNNGLWVVSEKRLNDFYHRRISYLIPFMYGNETGILNTEFNGGFQNNYAHTKLDLFYFPSIEGVVTVSPETFRFRKLIPDIKRIRINNKPAEYNASTYERTTQLIEFDFSVASFCPKFNVFYQYKLEGAKAGNQWSEMQKNGTVRFSYLQPGEYTLKVRALNGNNDPYPKVVAYRFTIKPYFYETWWFQIFVIFFVLSKAMLIIRYRIRIRRKKEMHQIHINNNIIELKLKAIQAKMNPHFIFNTLNNIQNLVVLDRKEAAEKAIYEFSTLLRKFLNQSDESFVTLEEELSIVEKYLLIEKIQFDGDLEIVIETKEDCSNRIIPTLLLQPVVENAVKHGLAHSSKPKKLVIRTNSTPEMLTISVDDNGIGREASKSINSSRESHVSHGLKLVEQKIEMINQKYGVKVNYEIIDKRLPETGTIVVFRIPLIREEMLKNED
jgi:protein tyrosine/serine phosphatase